MTTTIYTVGHSNLTYVEFLNNLRVNNIQVLVDVRSWPGSKYCPQFNKETLKDALKSVGIEYIHSRVLGGFRQGKTKGNNQGLKKALFRQYADYMQTMCFEDALGELITLAANQTVAIMCSEMLPWKCHRSLISDALVARNVKVLNICPTRSPSSTS